ADRIRTQLSRGASTGADRALRPVQSSLPGAQSGGGADTSPRRLRAPAVLHHQRPRPGAVVDHARVAPSPLAADARPPTPPALADHAGGRGLEPHLSEFRLGAVRVSIQPRLYNPLDRPPGDWWAAARSLREGIDRRRDRRESVRRNHVLAHEPVLPYGRCD